MDDKKIIDLYLNKKLSAYKISSILNISKDKVYYYLKKNNISRRSNSINSKKFFSDEYFFENIDSEEKAYWLGFIYADGFIISSRDAFGLSLSVKDESHIEKFLKSIKSNNKISRYFNNMGFEYSRIVIHSKKLKEDLIKNGCLENKTFLLKFPNIDKEYVRHFIRGYFDGDGAISRHTNNNFRFRLCGTESLLNSILFEIGFPNSKLNKRHKDRDNDNFDIDIGGNKQVLKILDYIYSDSSIFLDRKYKIYCELKSLYMETCR